MSNRTLVEFNHDVAGDEGVPAADYPELRALLAGLSVPGGGTMSFFKEQCGPLAGELTRLLALTAMPADRAAIARIIDPEAFEVWAFERQTDIDPNQTRDRVLQYEKRQRAEGALGKAEAILALSPQPGDS